MSQMRYMSRKQLKNVAAHGDAMGFNRQIARWVVKKVAKETKVGVAPMLVHEHIGGKLVEPHMRTLVGFRLRNGTVGVAFVDMDMAMFQSLPLLADADHQARSAIIEPRLEAAYA